MKWCKRFSLKSNQNNSLRREFHVDCAFIVAEWGKRNIINVKNV